MKIDKNEYDLYDPDWQWSDTFGVIGFFFWQIHLALVCSIFFDGWRK